MAIGTNSVEFVDLPQTIENGTSRDILFQAEIRQRDAEKSLQAEVTALLFVDDTVTNKGGEVKTDSAASKETVTVSQNTVLDGSISNTFNVDEVTTHTVTIALFIDFFGAQGFSKNNSLNDEEITTDSADIEFTEPGPEEAGFESFGDDAERPGDLSAAYNDRVPFKIVDIKTEEDVTAPLIRRESSQFLTQLTEGEITFNEFPNPTVAIDGAGRFAKHEIIGGATVRQKIGEDPLNISINGVCNAATANKIDALRDVRTAKIISSRLPGSTRDNNRSEGGAGLTVHIGSTSTEPIEDGGAADLTTGDLLYSYSINAIEVIQ